MYMGKFIAKDSDGYERIVFAEVLVPETVNVYGDFHTRESVRQFAYGFMMKGFGIDVDHDNDDVSATVSVIESFVARAGDADFIEGSWVVAMHIPDDELWGKVLAGEINGYSYEAFITTLDTEIVLPVDTSRYGQTQPDLYDGHTHDFFVILNDEGRVVTGGTSVTDGHSHTISQHTFTDTVLAHSHIFNFLTGSGGL